MFHVTIEPRRRLVRVRMEGMLDVAEVHAFSRKEQDAVRAMGLRSGEFDLLVETTDDLVQTQDVMEGFIALLRDSPLKARRIAMVRDGALTRMQTRRAARVREGAEVFDNLADAEAWLAAD